MRLTYSTVCFIIADSICEPTLQDSIHCHAYLVHTLIRCRVRPGRDHALNSGVRLITRVYGTELAATYLVCTSKVKHHRVPSIV